MEIEVLSEMNVKLLWRPWEYKRLVKNLKLIKALSKAFKELPIDLYNENFDEKLFWLSISECMAPGLGPLSQGVCEIPQELKNQFESSDHVKLNKLKFIFIQIRTTI
ncbi:hypothetical protein [Paenibacillus camerounensis]|uniref:hypothetical protein n=1 Tax=Paenibacillus camerounensis TaxID=1243663 RepID=UPI0005A89297|nr:hypothetical protein [Paenibacillus camerounensis]